MCSFYGTCFNFGNLSLCKLGTEVRHSFEYVLFLYTECRVALSISTGILINLVFGNSGLSVVYLYRYIPEFCHKSILPWKRELWRQFSFLVTKKSHQILKSVLAKFKNWKPHQQTMKHGSNLVYQVVCRALIGLNLSHSEQDSMGCLWTLPER